MAEYDEDGIAGLPLAPKHHMRLSQYRRDTLITCRYYHFVINGYIPKYVLWTTLFRVEANRSMD